jgi:predicted nuclease of predicted toxin-antitoxin system
VKLRVDEGLGKRWRDRLTKAGHGVDVVHGGWITGATDQNVLDAAVTANQALVTLEPEFADPGRFPPNKTAGIAVIRVGDRPSLHDLDAALSTLIDGLERAEINGQLWVVEPTRIRVYDPKKAKKRV